MQRPPLVYPDQCDDIVQSIPEPYKPDYTLKRVEPKPRSTGGENSPMYQNMLELMRTPGQPGVIASYGNSQSARTVAGDLRAVRDGRPRKSRLKRAVPPGSWEIFHQVLDDGSTGIFAIYLDTLDTLGSTMERDHS